MGSGKKVHDKYLYGIYSHEDNFMKAIKDIRHQGIEIDDAYSPFPVHGIDEVLGVVPTKLHTAGFVLGLTGTITAFGVITWVSAFNYPTIFGGKPFWGLPAFIPVIFELTVLMASVGMFFVYIKRNELFPGQIPLMVDERTTDDKFALSFGIDDVSEEQIDKIKQLLSDTGAEEVNIKTFED